MSCAYCLESNLCDVCVQREWITHCTECERHICPECDTYDAGVCRFCFSLLNCDSCKKPNFLYFCKCGYSYCKFCYDLCTVCLANTFENSKL